MAVSSRRRHRHGSSGRRTQEERRSRTQARLLEATMECLVDLGWSGTSTTEVARRAGVSRGAQQHHYPTKMVLVAAALEHLLEAQRLAYETAFAVLRQIKDVAQLIVPGPGTPAGGPMPDTPAAASPEQ
jgi:AcrR family transcriptional regulator